MIIRGYVLHNLLHPLCNEKSGYFFQYVNNGNTEFYDVEASFPQFAALLQRKYSSASSQIDFWALNLRNLDHFVQPDGVNTL